MRGNNQTHETAYLGLGSNLGDRYDFLRRGCREIDRWDSIEILAASSILETFPIGHTDQPMYLNQVLKIRTSESADDLLRILLGVERVLGRRRNHLRWGPRTIDIDILIYGTEIHDKPFLKIPHPELLNRPFFLRLLIELDGRLSHPVTGIDLKCYMIQSDDLPVIKGG